MDTNTASRLAPATPREPTTVLAQRVLNRLENAHSLLSDLEDRLNGPQPRGVSVGTEPSREGQAPSVHGAFVRSDASLDSLLGRIQDLLNGL